MFRRCKIVFQSISSYTETCIHTHARFVVRTMRNKIWIAAARHFDQQSDAFSCFLKRRLYISLREFKIEKEKRVSRDRLELASPERNSRIGRTNNFLAIELFLLLLCVLSLFVNSNRGEEVTIFCNSILRTLAVFVMLTTIFPILFLSLLVFFLF